MPKENCGHANQILILQTLDNVTYRCIDCNVKVWHIPMTLLEVSRWVDFKKDKAEFED
jgi:hypothetical protein